MILFSLIFAFLDTISDDILFLLLIVIGNSASLSVTPMVGRAIAHYESQAYEENSQQDDEVDLVFEKPK